MPHLNLHQKSICETSKNQEFSTSKRGRKIKPKEHVNIEQTSTLAVEEVNNELIDDFSQPKTNSSKGFPKTNSIRSISLRIQELKEELTKLRSERLGKNVVLDQEKTLDNELVDEKVNKNSNPSNQIPSSGLVTAEDIRQRYKEAVGLVS